MSNRVKELDNFGQSIWLDNINRKLFSSGELKKLIDMGLLGMTSNPTIFDNAISKSDDYDSDILELSRQGKSTFEIYDELTVRDIKHAADMLLHVYNRTNGLDGYVSLEVNPKLAGNSEETIKEIKRLHRKVGRRNLMFKVPATKEGFPVIEQMISEGININATLLFSVSQYENTANAYIEGLKDLKGRSLKDVASVASVFISRIDTAVDKKLDELLSEETDEGKRTKLKSLKGKAAVANTKLMYQKFEKIFNSAEFKKLAEKGARTQRPLWASTSTKNPEYSDIKYVTELIGKNTVNTLPDNTLYSFLDHGKIKEAIASDIEGAKKVIGGLKSFGIDIDDVCGKLLLDGVSAFVRSFDSLLSSIGEKASRLEEKK
ncbi:MAG: transaldolase [Candidatus Saganbacteria bacterium]|nr:transaldolase [Candidatus Saganbacteria bacterium]